MKPVCDCDHSQFLTSKVEEMWAIEKLLKQSFSVTGKEKAYYEKV